MRVRTKDDIFRPISFNSITELEAARSQMREDIRFASSIDLLKNDAPLNAMVFDTVEYDGFAVEKVIFQSLPGFYVTGNLFRPLDLDKKYPAVLNPHGHWEHGRLETIDLARIPQRCANQALRGMVAFAYDMVGYNDAKQVEHHFHDPAYDDWNFGRFSLQLNNSIKAIDFLQSLPYVDADRIACTGCSGGGTQTYFLAAIDRRIKAAAPINMASTRMQGGCNCENAPYLRRRFCNVDYMAAIAPCPLFMSGSDGDWTVTSETVEFPAVESIYRLLNSDAKFEHFYRSAPHCYERCTREKVYSFLCRNLSLDDSIPDEINVEFDTEALRIGNLLNYVPEEGYIHTEAELFEMVKRLISENLATLDEDAKAQLLHKVYLLDEQFELDIPYCIINEDSNAPRFMFANCIESEDTCGVEFFTTYNPAFDAKRVSALYKLMLENPTATFAATGKTAALVRIAAQLSDCSALELTGEAPDTVHIPGHKLVEVQ